MASPFQQEPAPNFSNPLDQKKFVKESQDSTDLLKKELDVNRAEQILLEKRVGIMKSLVNDLPSSDPQYSMLLAQAQMDQIELDELKRRGRAIEDLLQGD